MSGQRHQDPARTAAESGIEYILKIAVVGDAEVGKTTLVQQFRRCAAAANGDYLKLPAEDSSQAPGGAEPTVGVDFCSVLLSSVRRHTTLRLQFWDCAAGRESASVVDTALRHAAAAVVVYDTTRPDTLDRARTTWLPRVVNAEVDPRRIFCVGNKLDRVERSSTTVTEADRAAVSREFRGVTIIDASATRGTHVAAALRVIVDACGRDFAPDADPDGSVPVVSARKNNDDVNTSTSEDERQGRRAVSSDDEARSPRDEPHVVDLTPRSSDTSRTRERKKKQKCYCC